MTIVPLAGVPTPAPPPWPGETTSGGGFSDLLDRHIGATEKAGLLEAASNACAAPSNGLACVLAGLVAGPSAGTPLPPGNATTAAGDGRTKGAAAAAEEPLTPAPQGPPTTVPVLPGRMAGVGAARLPAGATAAVAGPVGHRPPAESAPPSAADVPGSVRGMSRGGVDLPSAFAVVPDGLTGVPGGPGAREAAGGVGPDVLSAPTVPGARQVGSSAGFGRPDVPQPAQADPPAGSRVAPGVDGIAPLPGAVPAAADGVARAAGAEPAASGGPAGSAVVDQVLEHVTRLVRRGDGTHRLTVRLHPADLGEVKVVLTLKDGSVDVTLAAGSRAREALHDGSPQLRSVLELAGSGTGQIVIRDLATGAVTFTSSAGDGRSDTGGAGAHQRTPDGEATAAGGGDADAREGGPGRDPSGRPHANAPYPDRPPGRPPGPPGPTADPSLSSLDLDL